MNSFIIHVLLKRSMSSIMTSEGEDVGQPFKMKKSERQIFVILLLVTFGFLILTTPAYSVLLYVNFADYTKSPYSFAQFQFSYSLAQKLYHTNYGINFYLHAISGKKFRTDSISLSQFWKARPNIHSISNVESSQHNNDKSICSTQQAI